MIESIKRDEGIRLADGRIVTLSAARISETKYEVMLLDPESGEEVTSRQADTVDEALADFRHMRDYYHTPEPKGRYKKLAEDLKAALAMVWSGPGMMTAVPATSMPRPSISLGGSGRRSRQPPRPPAWAVSSGTFGAASPMCSPSVRVWAKG